MYILATAGLRFLPLKYGESLEDKFLYTFICNSSEQNQLLEDLFVDIERDYDFLVEKTHFQVISGQLEGIYSWIAINYVLGRFQNNNTDSSNRSFNINTLKQKSIVLENRPTTVGILDMGGASAQIACKCY